ncbi:uncharacterized protein NECHADRAFT_82907 [Fusarium vanettenii 77-13-4]|uniref:Uncharacterized protein n=1 Tax=Fusarium vanettenii (strain ATCC MYA-4622 / CBS 123669 / FGSC 9596 / NRRL 45880 / 77-13-4) TaxID=660122 RepID=C7YX64_FUSV7|nr:uncharacterized protein NECHADRAFT_82907 [Fusarium vanettenii 77-13-4]EEU43777.1 hypothetical protein NECHADRAFT_82907 [Fusarium vanettenii 77-13-4]
MTRFQLNLRRGHKFVLSALLFGLSMARIMANVLRIAWAVHNDNARLVIAASIFANAGMLLLFVVNLILLQRVVRAYQPQIGWSKAFGWTFRLLYSGIAASLIMVVVSVVYSYYTLDSHTQSQLRCIRLVTAVYLAVLAFVPIPAVITILLLPRSFPIEHFGRGTMRIKVVLLLFTSVLLSLGACFRAGGAFIQRPTENPGWFNSRAAYYCFNYVIELVVVFTYALSRFDRRFHIPNGSKGPGDYSNGGLGGMSGQQSTDEETLSGDDDGVPSTGQQVPLKNIANKKA